MLTDSPGTAILAVFQKKRGQIMPFDRDLFLPVSRDDMARRGWDFYDFLLITGDAYVDHPS